MMRTGPVTGLAAQVGVLAGLSGSVGLTPTGWLTSSAYALALAGLVTSGLRRSGRPSLSPADQVTLVRAVLVGGVLALVASNSGAVVLIAAIAALALILDAADGWIARRTGTGSAFGARFDMEVDAFLLLVLAVHAARSDGAWIALIGAMRYLYAMAGWILPWLRAQVPYRYWRKVVAAVQGIVLVCAASGAFPIWLVLTSLGAALGLLVESFGRDVVWLTAQRLPRLAALGRWAFPTTTVSLAWDGRPLAQAAHVTSAAGNR